MKLIVGLGNPGEEYAKTRHNAGFMVVDAIASKIQDSTCLPSRQGFKIQDKFKAEIMQIGEVILIKPQTFMNRSGEAVRKVADFYQITPENIWVIHDDLDIKLSEYKIQLGKGPKKHNGLASVEKQLGTNHFWRARLGIENRSDTGLKSVSGEEYVLKPFLTTELTIFNETVKRLTNEFDWLNHSEARPFLVC